MNLTPARHSALCGFYVTDCERCKSTGCLLISVNNSLDLLVTDFLSFFPFLSPPFRDCSVSSAKNRYFSANSVSHSNCNYAVMTH